MRRLLVFRSIVLTAAFGGCARGATAADSFKSKDGPFPVAAVEDQWRDAARGVSVPLKIYYPRAIKDAATSFPLIVFSHGLGGSRDAYQYWSEYWASQGYIVINPTHETAEVVTALEAAAARSQNADSPILANAARHRVEDVSFILDQMDNANAGSASERSLSVFKGKVDLKDIGVAGHSFGAETALLLAGQLERLNGAGTEPVASRDPRITAVVAMSPQGAISVPQDKAFAPVRVPVLLLTGTADDNPGNLGKVTAADRRVVFENLTLPDTYQVIFQGATHFSFAPAADGRTPAVGLRGPGNPGGQTAAEESQIHTLVRECTAAFWDANLKGDAHARAWLRGDFSKVMGARGAIDMKQIPASESRP